MQRSAPIQPKTSEILPKICQNFATTLRDLGFFSNIGGYRRPRPLRPSSQASRGPGSQRAPSARRSLLAQRSRIVSVLFPHPQLLLMMATIIQASLFSSRTYFSTEVGSSSSPLVLRTHIVELKRTQEARKKTYREPGGSVHGERANFTGLVLGCIEARKQASKVEQSLS